jgi:all-trans-nonaprenyl-diphosphate synthase
MPKVSLKPHKQEYNLIDFIEPIESQLAAVEKELSTNLIDDNPFIDELLACVLQSGGKRIRPMLVLHSALASRTSGNEIDGLQIILAVLTELIHAASLVHDDILDSATIRRSVQTVNKRFNDRLAVLLGDLLFAQASICLARIMSPVIVGIYGQVLGDLCAGEIRQMKQQFNTEVNWSEYTNKSIAKTASLFSAGTRSSAILNQAGDEVIEALRNYGLHLGICFQIIDDLLDITGVSDAMGKATGSDLKAGVITAPALFVLERQDKAAKLLHELIVTRQVCSEEGAKMALSLIIENGGVEATMTLAHKHGQIAAQNLSSLPDSVYKDCLNEFINYVLKRGS